MACYESFHICFYIDLKQTSPVTGGWFPFALLLGLWDYVNEMTLFSTTVALWEAEGTVEGRKQVDRLWWVQF